MFETIEIKDVKIEMGQLVKELRKNQKLSQSDLADSIGASRTTIQNLELGKNFTIDTFLKVLSELDAMEHFNRYIVKSKNQFKNIKSLY